MYYCDLVLFKRIVSFSWLDVDEKANSHEKKSKKSSSSNSKRESSFDVQESTHSGIIALDNGMNALLYCTCISCLKEFYSFSFQKLRITSKKQKTLKKSPERVHRVTQKDRIHLMFMSPHIAILLHWITV